MTATAAVQAVAERHLPNGRLRRLFGTAAGGGASRGDSGGPSTRLNTPDFVPPDAGGPYFYGGDNVTHFVAHLPADSPGLRHGARERRRRACRASGARHGSLPGHLHARGAAGVRRGDEAPALVLAPGRARRLLRRAEARSRVRDGVLGRGHEPAQQSVLAAARAEPGRRLGSARAGAAARRQERARGRLHRRAFGVLPRCRDQGSSRAGPRLRAGDGTAARPLSGRSRGRDPLCARAQRRRGADRQDLRQAARGGGDSGGGGRASAGPSGRGALPHPHLRLPASGRPRARGGGALRRARRLGAARAPHAVAHLHAARPLGSLDRDQPPLGRGGARRQRDERGAARARLHGLRLPAERAG